MFSSANYGKDIAADIQRQLLELPQDYDLIEAQWDRYYRASEGHNDWATTAKQCVDFFEGVQWSPEEEAILAEEGRPKITLNKLNALGRLMLGYFRQNRYDIRFMPGHNGTGAQEIADTLTALSKQTSEMNQSDWNDAQVFQDGIQTGRGFWDIRLDMSQNVLGDVAERAEDPFSILIDPEAEDYDPNNQTGGWGYVFKNRWLSPTDIYMLFGSKRAENVLVNMNGMPLDTAGYYDSYFQDNAPSSFFGGDFWSIDRFDGRLSSYASPHHHIYKNRKLIRVLDCQHRQLKKVNFFYDYETGHEVVIPDTIPRERIQRTLEYIRIRQLPIILRTGIKKRVRWTITAADRVLYDEWSPYDRYTIVPYFPYFRRGKTRGMLEDLLDPQREVNRRRSAMLHIVMSTSNAGWMYEEGSLEDDMQVALEEQGSRPGLHLKYNEGYRPPQRIEPAATPVAMKKLEDDSNYDIKEISGINDSALGNVDKVQSGRAIQARQRQAVLGTEIYFDNFSRSRELKGRNQCHIYQRYYTEPRIIRVRGEEGKTEEHVINQRNAAGDIVNNITMGIYQVAIDETPVSSTFMQGQFAEAMELRAQEVPIPDDILVELSSMPRKDEIKKRMEEERLVRENSARMENMMGRSQMGIPPNQSLPPIMNTGPLIMDPSPVVPPAPVAPPVLPMQAVQQPQGAQPPVPPQPMMQQQGMLIPQQQPPMAPPPLVNI